MWTTVLPVIVWNKYIKIQTFCLILYIVLNILLAVILQLILEISTTYRLASYLLADNWLICRLHTQCMISKCDVKLVRCDDVFVVIYTMYLKQLLDSVFVISGIIKVLGRVSFTNLSLWFGLSKIGSLYTRT